jgi:hypothetical protein
MEQFARADHFTMFLRVCDCGLGVPGGGVCGLIQLNTCVSSLKRLDTAAVVHKCFAGRHLLI